MVLSQRLFYHISCDLHATLEALLKVSQHDLANKILVSTMEHSMTEQNLSSSFWKLSLRNLLFLGGIFHLQGCWDSFQAEYADPTGIEIVDDRWSSVDARKTSEVLIRAMLSKPATQHRAVSTSAANSKPIVIVDDIQNRTDEHIDTVALGEAIRDELINSGAIRFVDAQARP